MTIISEAAADEETQGKVMYQRDAHIRNNIKRKSKQPNISKISKISELEKLLYS